jgi:hypothetical protein
MDEGYNSSEFAGDFYYWEQIKKIRQMKGELYFTDLFFQECEYQAKYEGHIIASVHGGTGTMKSLFAIYCLDRIGQIFGVPFDLAKNCYVGLSDLDNGLRAAPFRSSHLKDEQPLTQFGAGSWAEQMSLRDFENTQRKSQRNIFFVAPQLRDHQHRFIFQSMDDNIRRIENFYCRDCPPAVKAACFEKKFETNCPDNVQVLTLGGVPFWKREGYPDNCEFVLYTAKNFESSAFPRIVPRGIIKVPMPNPELVIEYEKIKNENIVKLQNQTDSSHEYINFLIKNFLDSVGMDKLVRLKGTTFDKTFRIKGEFKIITLDNRYYAPEQKGVIQSYFFEFTQSSRRYTSQQMKIITDRILKFLLDYCDERNKELKAEKDKKRDEQNKDLNEEKE